MQLTALSLLLFALLTTLACGATSSGTETAQPATPQTATPAPQSVTVTPKSATCALLSNEDIEAVQGEAPADAQGSEHLTGSLITSQCFYRLPTFNKSITLEIISPAPGVPHTALADSWRESVGREAVEERERERERKEKGEREHEQELEREKAAGQTREGGHHKERDEDEEAGRPQKVAGIGDDAVSIQSLDNITIYILKRDAIIHLSLGGADDGNDAMKRAKALARKILKHF